MLYFHFTNTTTYINFAQDCSQPSTPGTPGLKKKAAPGSLALNQGRVVEPVLVHSGVILTMLQLLPAMHHDEVCNVAFIVHLVNTNYNTMTCLLS